MIDDYQEVAEFWPAHRWAANAQYMVGIAYNEMREEAAADGDGERAAELEEAMKWAHDAVIENYPGSHYQLQAYKHMGEYYFKQKRWAEALEYLEQWYEREPELWYVRDMLEMCHERKRPGKYPMDFCLG